MHKFKILIILTISILILSSCSTIKEELGFSDKAGLTYNDQSVSEKDLDADFKQLENNKVFTDQFTDPQQPFLVDGKISPDFKVAWMSIQLQLLIYKEARIEAKLKITKADKDEAEVNAKAFFATEDEEVNAKVWKEFDKSFKERTVNALAEQSAFKRTIKAPSDKEIKEFYDSQCDTKKVISHILVKTEAEAKAVKAQLDAGDDFAKVANEKSTDGSGKEGGELGCFNGAGQFVKEFEDGANALSIGQISNPVKSEYGFHIIKVDTYPPLDKIKDKIIEELKVKTFDEENKKLIEGSKDAKVKVSSKYGKVEKSEGIPKIVKIDDKDSSKDQKQEIPQDVPQDPTQDPTQVPAQDPTQDPTVQDTVPAVPAT